MFLLLLHFSFYDARVGPKTAPRSPQEAPRWTLVGPKMAPRWPKMAPRGPKMAPKGPRWSQDDPMRSQDGSKRPQDGPKMAPRGAEMGSEWVKKHQIPLKIPIFLLLGDCCMWTNACAYECEYECVLGPAPTCKIQLMLDLYPAVFVSSPAKRL